MAKPCPSPSLATRVFFDSTTVAGFCGLSPFLSPCLFEYPGVSPAHVGSRPGQGAHPVFERCPDGRHFFLLRLCADPGRSCRVVSSREIPYLAQHPGDLPLAG